MTQTLVIPNWVPAQLANGPQGSWRATWRKKKDASSMAQMYALQAGWVFVPGKVRLEIVMVFPQQRRRDVDNTYHRAKAVIDGLKGAFFTDDDTEHLDLHVSALVVKGVKETRVSLSAA